MPFQVFVDDSGGRGQGPILVFAGLISTAEKWALFSTDWNECLALSPRIGYFKMREAAGRFGQFRGFSKDSRDQKLRLLARSIRELGPVLIHDSVDLQGFEETIGSHAPKPLSQPYILRYYSIVMTSCLELYERGVREEAAVIFDEHSIFAPRAKSNYPLLRKIVRREWPEIYGIMPTELLFGSDNHFLPLQAADLFAWLFRHSMTHGPHSFAWLRQELGPLELSPRSLFHSGPEMLAMVRSQYSGPDAGK